MDEQIIRHLNYLLRTYDTTVDLMKKTSQRLQALNPDADIKHQDEYKDMESLKGKLSRRIGKELAHWPIWTEWMEGVPGIGPFLAGNLIITYYYKFTAVCDDCGGNLEKQAVEKAGKTINVFVCQECGKKAKGEGLLTHRIDERDFPNVSKWWAYVGRHIVDGEMPKRKKGIVSNWSTKARTLTYHIGDQINRQKETHPYKAFLLKEKKKYEKRNMTDSWLSENKAWTKSHIHNAAKNNTVKLLLSHFWHVARTLEGKSTDGPYADVVLKHSGIISPYYWGENVETKAA